MRDLYRLLDACSPEMLHAIAQAWELVLERGEPHEMALRLGASMLDDDARARLLATLSPQAEGALREIVAQGGEVPSHRLTFAHGAIRRLGPARLARERPWEQPENALEELFYKGLIYRAYSTQGALYGEVLLIPQQLLERLPHAALESAVPSTAPPDIVREDGDALAEDLLAVLVHLRQAGIRPARAEGAAALPLQAIDRGERLSGERSVERLTLLRHLLWRLRLVQVARGMLLPTSRARAWLESDAVTRRLALCRAWIEEPAWDELCLLPDIRLADSVHSPNAPAARRALLEVMARLPAEQWLTLDELVAAVKRRRPDYLRADGDYGSLEVRDGDEGALLSGEAAWERVEGALARWIVTRPLRWLGLLRLGYARDDGHATACALRSAQAVLGVGEGDRPALAHLLAPPTPRTEGSPSADVDPPRAEVRNDMTVTLPVAHTAYQRYQLERFAEWVSQGERAVYRLSAESIWRGHNAGVRSEQMLRFLRRIGGDQVPANVARILQEWGSRYGRVIVRRAVVLQTADECTMEALRASPEAGPLLGESLCATACLVEEERVDELTAALKALGIWPHVRL